MGEHGDGRAAIDADDEHWVQIPDDDVIMVIMTGSHARGYQRWLRLAGLHLFQVPAEDSGTTEPVYIVGVRGEWPEGFTRPQSSSDPV